MDENTGNVKSPDVTMRVRVGDAEIEVTGPEEFVTHQIKQFLERTPVRSPETIQPRSPASSPEHKLKPKSPAQFFKMSNPRTDIDRTLAGIYFLEKYRNVQDATAAEIRDVIKEAKVPPPTNVNDAVNRNIRKGLIMSAGDRENKMVFVVTSDGEAAVEEMIGNVKA
jgi:hypothetical protein